MAEICADLPEECWELIINGLDHHSHFESLSLVSKRFLLLTNRLRFKLTITDPTILIHGNAISKLLGRFRNLKALDLSSFHGNLEKIIPEIAISSLLNIESLDISNQKSLPVKVLKLLGIIVKKLKVFRCANLCHLSDADLLAIATMFPYLEELDISYPNNDHFDPSLRLGEATVSDTGIEALWSGLRNLRVLNVSGNHFITDRSIVGLSLNCLLLREIGIRDCSFITYNNIHFMMCNCHELNFISLNGIQISSSIPSCTYVRALCSLDFSDSVISDEFLLSIAKACLPLKRLALSRCKNFTFFGISSLLYAYQSLEYLGLIEAHFLTDQCMSELVSCLTHLVSINLDSCSRLTSLTFFTLASNCPLLENVVVSKTSLGKGDCSMEITENQRIKSLCLARNSHLSDGCLECIASACPNLELLDVSCSSGITEEGIANLLKTCCEIRHLHIVDCGGIKSLCSGPKLPKLEVLSIARSGFNDEGLATIWNRCPGLLKLDMEGCDVQTTKKVEEVVRKCERLKEINLKGCYNVNVLSVATWSLFSRPTLMKIIPPGTSSATDNQRKHLLSHGCFLSGE